MSGRSVVVPWLPIVHGAIYDTLDIRPKSDQPRRVARVAGTEARRPGVKCDQEARSWIAALYGSYRPFDGGFVDGVLGFGRMEFDTRRRATNGAIAFGDRSGDMALGSLTAGFERSFGTVLISTYGRFDLVSGDLDRYVETGAGLNNLAFAPRDLDSRVGVIGVRGRWALPLRTGSLTHSGRLELRHEFQDMTSQALDYSDLTGFRYAIEDERWLRDELVAEYGVELILTDGYRFTIDVGGRFSDGGESATLRLLLARRF